MPKEIKFICDVHLGVLTRRLRLLGFDVKYQNHFTDEILAEISCRESRILLSRGRRLLMRGKVRYGILIRHTNSEKQIQEIITRLTLQDKISPFTRCINCNGVLNPLHINESDFDKVKSSIHQKVRSLQKVYTVCRSCQKVFWKGSHYPKLLRIIKKILDT